MKQMQISQSHGQGGRLRSVNLFQQGLLEKRQ